MIMRRLLLAVAFLLAGWPAFAANLFVASTGSNTAPYDTWAKAATTMATAVGAMAAGDTIYADAGHSETATAGVISLTFPGTAASPNKILSVTPSGASGTTGAIVPGYTVATSGANNITLVSGIAYIAGVTLSAGSAGNNGSLAIGNSTSVATFFRFDGCILNLNNTNTGATINFGPSAAPSISVAIELVNTQLQFGATGQFARPRGAAFMWRDTASGVGGVAPTTLLKVGSGNVAMPVVLHAVGLSAIASARNLIDVSAGGGINGLIEVSQLGASVTPVTGTWVGPQQGVVRLHNSDSGATNYRLQESSYMGTVTSETSVTRVGGASDGAQSLSYKAVSSANTQFFYPLPVLWGPKGVGGLAFWNNTTGSSITVTVEVLTDNVVLTNADAWLEIWALSTSGFPLSVIASSAPSDVLASGSNLTTSSASWNGTGGFTLAKPQSMSVSFTPQLKGPYLARVMLAKASTTMYVDPKINAGGQPTARQFLNPGGYYENAIGRIGVGGQ